jgi:hypothetical protein
MVEWERLRKVCDNYQLIRSSLLILRADEDFISFIESLKEPQTKPFDENTLETLGKAC